MKISKSKMLYILILVLLAFLAVVYWPALYLNIIYPISGALWIFLRIFILSIDQKYYWGVLIFGALVYFMCILFQESGSPEADEEQESETIAYQGIESWENTFNTYTSDWGEKFFIKRELTNLLTTIYLDADRRDPSYIILDKIKNKQIEIPEHIYSFLFQDELNREPGSWQERVKKFVQTPIRWIKHGEQIRHRRLASKKMVNEIITFLETSLEIRHDD